jgi:hypothetical protein
MLKDVRAHDIDITERAITFGRKEQSLTDVEVVLTDRVTGLSGRIVDEDGRPVVGAHVIVFSDDHGRWYPGSRFLREGTTAQDGLYRLTGLPSGSYYAAAVARLPVEGEEAWQDPQGGVPSMNWPGSPLRRRPLPIMSASIVSLAFPRERLRSPS